MPPIDEKTLKKHIADGSFKPLYLIYGDEKYLVRHYTDKLVEKAAGKKPSEFSLHRFDGFTLDLPRLQAAVLMVPFMSERCCVLLEDVNFETLSKEDWDSIVKILSDIPETTTVIVSMPTLEAASDKGERLKKLSALAGKIGICAKLEKRTELSLERDVVRWAEKAGTKISSANAAILVSYTTNDIRALKNEIEKLAAFADGQEITAQMIDMLVAKNLQTKVFALADSVIDGKADDALQRLRTLISQKESPQAIIAVIGGVYVDAYRVSAAASAAVSTEEVARDFEYKNRAFLLKKAAFRAKRLSPQALRESVSEITKTDVRLKSVSTDSSVELEKLIVRLMNIAGAPSARRKL